MSSAAAAAAAFSASASPRRLASRAATARAPTARRAPRATVRARSDAKRRSRSAASVVVRADAAADGPNKSPFVKVCGVTSAADATHAARAGADFVGMILWPKSKRSISLDVAKEVAAAARADGAVPVGVFVNETAAEIVAACEAAGIDHAQLHGDGARASLVDLPMKIKAIYVVNASADGAIATPMPGDEAKLTDQRNEALKGEKGWRAAIDWVNGPRRTVDWLLIDGVNAGSGEAFEWGNLKVPRGVSRKGWLLAGGLTPENVAEAVGCVGRSRLLFSARSPSLLDFFSFAFASRARCEPHDLTRGDAISQ